MLNSYDKVYIHNAPGDQFECKKTQYANISGVVWDVSLVESVITEISNLLSYDQKSVFYSSDLDTLKNILDTNNCLFISLIAETKIISPSLSTDFLLNYINRNDCCYYKFLSSVIEQQNSLDERIIPVLLKTIKICNSDLMAILSSTRMLGKFGNKAYNILPELRKLSNDNKDSTVKLFIEQEAIEPIEKSIENNN